MSENQWKMISLIKLETLVLYFEHVFLDPDTDIAYKKTGVEVSIKVPSKNLTAFTREWVNLKWVEGKNKVADY